MIQFLVKQVVPCLAYAFVAGVKGEGRKKQRAKGLSVREGSHSGKNFMLARI